VFQLHEGLFFVAFQPYLLLVVKKNKTSTSQNDSVQSDGQFRHLVQDLPVAVYTCDFNGQIQYFNAAAEKLWGRTPEIGKDVWCGSWKIFDTEGNPVSLADCPMAMSLKEGKSIRGIEIIVERPDGKQVHVLPHPDPILDEQGKVIGGVNMLVDITEHKQTREANILLNHYNSQLEEFAYAASHDLQEPIRKIHAFSSMLLEQYSTSLDEKGKNFVVKILESAGRMNSLIQDLLNFSRNTRSDELFAVTDLNRVIENIQSDLELMITAEEALITVDPLPVIRAIPSQMNRLFYNLVQNSLKFSRLGVPTVISITIANKLVENSEGRLFLQINFADNGIGFDLKDSDKIFQLFQRLNDRHSYSGNGIGLAICKKIIENHEGTITAKSTPGEGSVFSVTLPVDRVFIG
jgi:PAS domain S-box-containing protein